jgi:hypothetical protein
MLVLPFSSRGWRGTVEHIGCSRLSEQRTGKTVPFRRLPQHSSGVLQSTHCYILHSAAAILGNTGNMRRYIT